MRGLLASAAALTANALHAVAAAVSVAPQNDGPFTRARIMAEGNKRDRYQGIRSKGRQGATERAALMAAAMPNRLPAMPDKQKPRQGAPRGQRRGKPSSWRRAA